MVVVEPQKQKGAVGRRSSRPNQGGLSMSLCHQGCGCLALSIAMSAAAGVAAQAQTSSPPSAPAQVTEIIVTAQKRSQSINTVGMAITAVTGDQLKQQGVNTVADLVKIDPSFVFSQAQRGEPVYTIRGIGYNDFSLAATPTVSVYTDEAPYALPVMTKGAGFDLDRVEVLKGPQGTLFGQNATGGAVNYIAAKPTSTLEASLEGGYASFGASNVNGFVSGPITDTLKGRIAFNIDNGGAWQRSDTRHDSLGAKDDQQARVLLDWTPTERLKVSANLNGWADRSDTQAGQEIGLDLQTPKFAAFVPEVVDEPIAPKNDQAADWLQGLHPRNNESFAEAALRVDYRLTDKVHLIYLGSYQGYNQHDLSNNVGGDIDFYLKLNGVVDALSQEVRLAGKAVDDRLDWLVGVNYGRTRVAEDQNETLLDSTSAYALTTVPLALHEAALPPFEGVQNVSTDVSVGKSVFANVQYHLAKTLDLHGGVRYTETDITHGGCTQDIDGNAAAGFTALETLVKKGVGVVPIAQGQCVTFGPTLTPGYQHGELNQHNTPWSVGLDWTPIPKTLIYASVSKGYKAGSFPTLTASSYLQLKPVTQESVLAYEAGVKSRLWQGRVELTGAVFHYTYDDKQVEAREPDPEGVFGFLNVLLNVPKSSEDGAEFTAKFRPTEHLTLSWRTTYLDSHVDGSFLNYNPYVNTPINLAGEPFPNTPRWATGLDAQYNWDIIPGYAAYVGADARYQSRSQGAFGTQNAIAEGYPSFEINSYTLLDLRAGVTSRGGHWRGELYGNNVTDTYYWTQVARPGEAVVRLTGLPDTFGLRVRYSY
jgi:outer membrane receptor protein involved in Fe transport